MPPLADLAPQPAPPPLRPLTLRGLVVTCALVACSLALADQPAPPPPPPPAEATAPADPEPETVLILKDGQQFTGLLVERTDKHIILRIAGIRTTFSTDSVEHVRILPSVDERYKGLRDAIDDADSDQILRLVEWLIERRRFDLARKELTALIKRQPQNAQAERKLAMVDRMAALRDRPQQRRQNQPASPAKAPAAGEAPAVPLLTESQIALMKVYEVDLTARPAPRVVVPPETARKLFDEFGGHPSVPQTPEGREALLRRPGAELLDVIFSARARELYPAVRVLDQPDSMRRFRDDVLRGWLANACATSACHGGAEAGRFILPTRALGTDPTTYTSFWIINQFRLADGSPLIDWENPPNSPLLQFALPRDVSKRPHPPTLPPTQTNPAPRDPWKPAFLNPEDHRFAATVDWIQSAYRPRPDYTLEYQPLRPFTPPPQPAAPTQPATPPPTPPPAAPPGR